MNHSNFCPQGGGRGIAMTNGVKDYPCICDLLQYARTDERDTIRSQVEGVYRVTGDVLIKLIIDYIDKRGKE